MTLGHQTDVHNLVSARNRKRVEGDTASLRQKHFKNYPSATPTRKHVDFQRGCSISMFFGFGVLDFWFWALGFKFWVAGFEFGVLDS